MKTKENRSANIETISRVQRPLELPYPTETLNFWFMNNDNRFHRVNSINLKYTRSLLGWTQAELGRRAGYSERLIRKAESGGALKVSTIQDISEAITAAGVPITVLQLTLDYLTLVRGFIEAYDSSGVKVVELCKEILTDDIELFCPADPNKAPFGGTWKRTEGIQKFFDAYFETFARRSGTLIPTYFTSTESVIARFNETLFYRGHRLPAIRCNLHFAFREGLISRIDAEFDHQQASRDLKHLRNRLRKSGSEGR